MTAPLPCPPAQIVEGPHRPTTVQEQQRQQYGLDTTRRDSRLQPPLDAAGVSVRGAPGPTYAAQPGGLIVWLRANPQDALPGTASRPNVFDLAPREENK